MIFCQGKTLSANYLPRELQEQAANPAVTVTQGPEQILRIEMPMSTLSLERLETAVIEEILHLSGHNKSQAAKILGLTRFALDRRLKKISEE
jgi:two-component system response regulator AtoC